MGDIDPSQYGFRFHVHKLVQVIFTLVPFIFFNSFYRSHLVFTHGNGAARHFNGRKAGAAEPRAASPSAERSGLRIRLIIVRLALRAAGP